MQWQLVNIKPDNTGVCMTHTLSSNSRNSVLASCHCTQKQNKFISKFAVNSDVVSRTIYCITLLHMPLCWNFLMSISNWQNQPLFAKISEEYVLRKHCVPVPIHKGFYCLFCLFVCCCFFSKNGRIKQCITKWTSK